MSRIKNMLIRINNRFLHLDLVKIKKHIDDCQKEIDDEIDYYKQHGYKVDYENHISQNTIDYSLNDVFKSSINPASGFVMIGGVDTSGNMYGTSSTQNYSYSNSSYDYYSKY